MPMKLPEFVRDTLQLAGASAHRISLITTTNDANVWLVNGKLVRDRLDIEFTNGGHHWSHKVIPENEVWIDREEPGADEQQLWTARQLLERQLCAGGMSEDDAFDKAQKMEIYLRRTSSMSDDAYHPTGNFRLMSLPNYWGFHVYVVNGKLVRNMVDIEFSIGGNGIRYEYIPDQELWLDSALLHEEYNAVLRHEAVEATLMKQGTPYEQAHEQANKAEKIVRKFG